ncbi:MAG: TRAP transporter substrate-binding protein DctP, partial [Rhodospirillales bacterium]|nr:TRAP transporter substrate-binding protein DctP [Rhodospirillales bacterium]
MFKSVAVITGLALAFSAGTASAQATLKAGTFASIKSFSVRDMYIPWLRQVEKDSGGAVKFKEFWGGQLIRSPRKQYEGMMNGIQDVAPLLPSYTHKLFPDFSFNALPFLFRDGEEASYVGWKMFAAGHLRGLGKVHVAGIWTNDNGGMHFSKKLSKIEEIKGIKMRAAGPAEAAAIKVMGGVPVGMSITQVAQSLHRGVIQGTFNGWSALQSFKITPLITTHVDMPFGVRGFFFAVNKKVFDGLSGKIKAAIVKNSGMATSRKFGRMNEARGARFRV